MPQLDYSNTGDDIIGEHNRGNLLVDLAIIFAEIEEGEKDEE